MRHVRILLALHIPLTAFSQAETPYPKEVKVNWDTRAFEAPLPIDEPFVMVVYSTATAIPNLALVRYIKKSGTFYFYEQPITLGAVESNVANSKVTKATQKEAFSAAGAKTSSETVLEYNGNPSDATPHVRRVYVTPLRANFYYSLITAANYTTGDNSTDFSADGMEVQAETGAINNTYLSYQANSNRRVTAIIGLAFADAERHVVRPQLGLRYNFVPINRDMQSRQYEEIHHQGGIAQALNRFSLDVGLTLASIEDSSKKQYDLFGKTNLLTGLGCRISDGFFLSSGVMWYNLKNDSNPYDVTLNVQPAWFVSLSFDWDFSKSFDALKKTLGATF